MHSEYLIESGRGYARKAFTVMKVIGVLLVLSTISFYWFFPWGTESPHFLLTTALLLISGAHILLFVWLAVHTIFWMNVQYWSLNRYIREIERTDDLDEPTVRFCMWLSSKLDRNKHIEHIVSNESTDYR